MRKREHGHRWHRAAEGVSHALTIPLSVAMVLATATSIAAVAASALGHMAGA